MDKLSVLRRRLGIAIVGLSLVLPYLFAPAVAHAFPVGGQLQARAITMSSSTPSATAVTYQVAFKPQSSYTIKGIIIDFCAADPIIGDSTCANPGSLSTASATMNASPGIAGYTNLGVGTGSWTVSALNSNRTFKAIDALGPALTSGTLYDFTIGAMVNPSITGTFYARIITYTASAGDIASYAPGTEGSVDATDYGGIALSTAAVINITAKVAEALAFCVYKSACSDNPSFTIGHAVGSATVLTSGAVDTQTVTFSISTNAQGGVLVRLFGDTLKSGTNSIPAVGATAGPITAGTADFGLYLSTLGTNLSATAPYTTSASTYAFDVTSSIAVYGDQIASLSGPTNASISTITYGATASNTSAAGTYTTTHQLIATGTF